MAPTTDALTAAALEQAATYVRTFNSGDAAAVDRLYPDDANSVRAAAVGGPGLVRGVGRSRPGRAVSAGRLTGIAARAAGRSTGTRCRGRARIR